MSLTLQSLNLWNIQNIPFFSKNVINEVNDLLRTIPSLPSKERNEETKLNVLVINNLFAYRCGVFFKFLPDGFFQFLSNCNSFTFQRYLNNLLCFNNNKRKKLQCNDAEIFYGSFMLLNRIIPIFNYGNYDLKEKVAKNSVYQYFTNYSLPKFYNLSSLFSFEPFFDSGCGILANEKPKESGFEPFTSTFAYMQIYLKEKRKEWENNNINVDDILDSFITKGITWNYFEKNNHGVLVITFKLSELSFDSYWKIFQFSMIEELKKYLLEKFLKIHLDQFELYIVGDFQHNMLHEYYNQTNDSSNLYNFFFSKFEVKHLFDSFYVLYYIMEDEDEKMLNASHPQFLYNNVHSTTIGENVPDTPTSSPSNENSDSITIINPLNEIQYENDCVRISIQDVDDFDKEETEKVKSLKTLYSSPTNVSHIEDYFKNKLSPSSSSTTDDEWTKV